MHIGIIPDGNRRWAKKNNLPILYGYKKGAKKVEYTIEWCYELNIDKLTIYILSEDNFKKRNKREINILLNLLDLYIKKIYRKIIKKDIEIKFNFFGDFNDFPRKLVNKFNDIMEKTKENKKMDVNLLINYSSTHDIVQSFKKIIENKEEIKIENIIKNLLIKDPIDLIIRTGGYSRLSGFPSLQSSYSEIYVLNKFWPDFKKEDLINAINWFKSIQRNFGK
ncbi:MAG: polyprenyl diphosphate synthase [Nanopusillaceae archaeon]|jgi:undecaprenyl diphosphate synthase